MFSGSQMRSEGSISACLHSQKSSSRYSHDDGLLYSSCMYWCSNIIFCTCRMDSAFPHQSGRSSVAVRPTVSGVRPLMEDAGDPDRPEQRRVPQRSHPYLSRVSCPVSRTSAGLQKSASAHSLSSHRECLIWWGLISKCSGIHHTDWAFIIRSRFLLNNKLHFWFIFHQTQSHASRILWLYATSHMGSFYQSFAFFFKKLY